MPKLIIQTVVKPYFVFDFETPIQFFAEQKEFYTAMQDVEITPKTQIMINRGPGSYSGIRIGLSYVLGLTHGGLLSAENVTYFTTFDLTPEPGSLFLKGWPRSGGDFDIVKGYLRTENDIIYSHLKDIPQESTILIEENDTFEDTNGMQYIHLKELFNEDNLLNFAENTEFSSDNTPLYINPVHITS